MIGTGTGVVPMISYLREFLGQLEMISAHHFIEQKQKTRKERFLLQRDRAAEPLF
jgi:ferredoxin-NADP reductase